MPVCTRYRIAHSVLWDSLPRTTRGEFNNERATSRDPMVQENFKITENVFYKRKKTLTKYYSALK